MSTSVDRMARAVAFAIAGILILGALLPVLHVATSPHPLRVDSWDPRMQAGCHPTADACATSLGMPTIAAAIAACFAGALAVWGAHRRHPRSLYAAGALVASLWVPVALGFRMLARHDPRVLPTGPAAEPLLLAVVVLALVAAALVIAGLTLRPPEGRPVPA